MRAGQRATRRATPGRPRTKITATAQANAPAAVCLLITEPASAERAGDGGSRRFGSDALVAAHSQTIAADVARKIARDFPRPFQAVPVPVRVVLPDGRELNARETLRLRGRSVGGQDELACVPRSRILRCAAAASCRGILSPTTGRMTPC